MKLVQEDRSFFLAFWVAAIIHSAYILLAFVAIASAMKWSWESASYIASVIETALILVSVYFVYRELKERNELAKAANNQTLFELATPMRLELMKDAELSRLWLKGAEFYDDLSVQEKFRYDSLLNWWLRLYENIFYQYKSGWLHAESYNQWNVQLDDILRSHEAVRHRLPAIKYRQWYRRDFIDHLEALLRGNSPARGQLMVRFSGLDMMKTEKEKRAELLREMVANQAA